MAMFNAITFRHKTLPLWKRGDALPQPTHLGVGGSTTPPVSHGAPDKVKFDSTLSDTEHVDFTNATFVHPKLSNSAAQADAADSFS